MNKSVDSITQLSNDNAKQGRESFVFWLLILALLHGLLYLAIVPPWQHYDEPTHFEYARLIALWGRRPAVGETDLETNREIANSMYRFKFWQPGVYPDLLSATPPHIGYDEKVHPPLYYAVVALPISMMRYLPIEHQLYVGRFITVLFYVLMVLCAWRIATIIAPSNPLLQMSIPLLLLLMPALTNQMSAVNNDALVNFSITVLLLGCVYLIRDGFKLIPLCLVVLSIMVAVMAKRTAVVGIIPLILALFWSFYRRPIRWWVWLLGITFLGIFLSVSILEYRDSLWNVHPWVIALDQQYLRLSLDTLIARQPTLEQLVSLYPRVIDVLLTSFWGRFGWGHVVIAPFWDWVVRLFTIATIVGLVVGTRFRLYTDLQMWQRRVLWLCGVFVVLAWFAVLVRFDMQQSFYVPQGRYMHLAVLPTILLMGIGVQGLAPKVWRAKVLFALVCSFVLLDIAALASIISYYYI
jgi:hypothetical protein